MVSLGFRKLWLIRLAADYQTVTMTLFWVQVWLWEVLWRFSSHWTGHCQLSYEIHFLSHDNPIEKWFVIVAWEKTTLENMILFAVGSWGTHIIELHHLSHLLQMLNNCRMVDTEFFGKFSCSFKRISSDSGSQLVTVNFWQPVTALLVVKALVSFTKLPERLPHCMSVSSSWVKSVIDVASCLCWFMTYFELK